MKRQGLLALRSFRSSHRHYGAARTALPALVVVNGGGGRGRGAKSFSTSYHPIRITDWQQPKSDPSGLSGDMTTGGTQRAGTAYIALGSNLGDRVANIEQACRAMEERDVRIKRTSSLWETEPMYYADQGRFVNGACEVSHVAPLVLRHGPSD